MLPLLLLAAGQAVQAFPSPVQVVDVDNLNFFKRDVSNDTVTIQSPNATGGAWSAALERSNDLISQMTLEEKVKIATGQNGRCVGNTAGVERLGIPALCLEDGPAGVRPISGVSQFPAGLTTACTWDKDLMYQRSKAMGQEFYDVGVHIALAPVTGGPLGRAPLGGRNWEGSFADPYGTGVYSYESVKGIQDSGVAACSKHWIGYEQETDRRPNFNNPPGLPVDSLIDDQTTHELYMWGFAEAVRAGSAHMMCSYNMVNGTHSCSDDYSLNHLLKGELNFQGSVISDWGGAWNSAPMALAGMDMLQPGSEGYWNTTLIDLVNNGTVPESRLDDQIARIVAPYFWLGQADKPLPPVPFNANAFAPAELPATFKNVQKASTLKLIKKIGEDGAVLLKNNGGLPIKNPSNIAVLGEDAGPNAAGAVACGVGGSDCPPDNVNGTMSIGFGSGYAYPNNLITPLAGIQYRALQDGNFRVVSSLDNYNLLNISSTAADVDTAIVFASAWAGEGQDRTDFELSADGESVILAAASECNNTIVVLHIPGAVDVESWIDHPNITAVIAPMLPGEQSGVSLPSLLFGDVSPSGKMVFTVAKSPDDYPPNTIVDQPTENPVANFTEGLNIDYRWFDAHDIEPRFPFGYGLSYSTFSYSGLQVQKQHKADDKAIQQTAEPFYEYDGSNSLYDEVVSVSVDIKNTGSVTACEVAQLYIGFPEETEQPPWQLRGFEKVKQLEPGETATATFTLRRKDVSTWHTVEQHWKQASKIKIGVGAHSRDLNLKQTLSF